MTEVDMGGLALRSPLNWNSRFFPFQNLCDETN